MSLQDVLLDELRDMYSAENLLVKAFPKLAQGAKNDALKTIFTKHLAETKEQVLRLRTVFEHLGKKPTGKHCNGMEGVISEGQEALEEDMEGSPIRLNRLRFFLPRTEAGPSTPRRSAQDDTFVWRTSYSGHERPIILSAG